MVDTYFPDGRVEHEIRSCFALNDPRMERDVLYARNPPKAVECLCNAFPGRRFCRYDPRAEGAGHLFSLD